MFEKKKSPRILAGLLVCCMFSGAVAVGFQGVDTASVDVSNRVPRLCLDGVPTIPSIFFFNTDIQGVEADRFLRSQVHLAAEAGVHIYSLCFRFPKDPGTGAWDFSVVSRYLDPFIEADPKALFLLRLFPGPDPSWPEWKNIPSSEFATFYDGSSKVLSAASEFLFDAADEDMAVWIRHLESGPYGKRIIGYQPGAPDSEMFQPGYRERGPDLSSANRRSFRRWLQVKYRTEEALRESWHQPDVEFDSVDIPQALKQVYPIRGVGGGGFVDAFFDKPEEQACIDFSLYSSDVMAEHIIDWAAVIKRETKGKKLAVFFYGYTYELPGSISGHYSLQRVLNCPDVDALASPYSYIDRQPGGAGGFMTAIDSVIASGKLWFVEDDSRTSLVDRSTVHQGLWNTNIYSSVTLDDTLSVLDRNLASIIIHRAGVWWMDLTSAGAFNDSSLWDLLCSRRALYQEIYNEPSPLSPDVAVLVDESSKCFGKNAWEVPMSLARLRDSVTKSGASVGHYTVLDFVNGRVPKCRVYLFANSYKMTQKTIKAVQRRIKREGAFVIWCYAPGYMVEEMGVDAQNITDLTGFDVQISVGRQGSQGVDGLADLSWGRAYTVDPRIVIVERDCTVLGQYVSDRKPSAAIRRNGGVTSVLLADLDLSSDVLRELFQMGGAHIWAGSNEVVYCDQRFLAVHSGTAGEKLINIPDNVTLAPLSGNVNQQRNRLKIHFLEGETKWFRLGYDN